MEEGEKEEEEGETHREDVHKDVLVFMLESMEDRHGYGLDAK